MTISAQEYIKIFNGYNAQSSEYVYTTEASTGADDGWYSADYDDVLVGIYVGTLNATSVDYRIEGRGAGNYTDAIDLYSDSLTATSGAAEAINIVEKVKEIRVGLKITTTATPNNTHVGLILTESA